MSAWPWLDALLSPMRPQQSTMFFRSVGGTITSRPLTAEECRELEAGMDGVSRAMDGLFKAIPRD